MGFIPNKFISLFVTRTRLSWMVYIILYWQVDVYDGSSITFNKILNASFNIANQLKYECGIQKSDVVGIFSENTIWYPSIILAVWHIGGVCALFNPMYNTCECHLILPT